MDARVVSVQVGMPRTIEAPVDGRTPARRGGKPWITALFKEPVVGPVRIGREGLSGDGQYNRKYHGGPERAVLMYAFAHYAVWRDELPAVGAGFAPGAFGENLTVTGLSEDTVRIGQRLAIGDVVLQVASARQPCVNLSRRFAIADMVVRVRRTARSGWYCRVLREGSVEAGLPVVLVPPAADGDDGLGPTVAEALQRRADG